MDRFKIIVLFPLSLFVLFLLVLLLPLVGRTQTAQTTVAQAQGGAGQTAYHTSTDQVIQDIRAIAATNPSIVKEVPSAPNTIGGKPLTAFKISKDAATDCNKNRVIFIGTQHAREWTTTEIAFNLAKYLIESYNTDAKVKSYIDNMEIWVLPVFNPDGYDYSKTKYAMQRKNRRDNGASCNQTDAGWGVDLNRNFDISSGSSSCTAEDYHGPSSMSEAEPQALKSLLDKYPFKSLLTWHSYMSTVLYSGTGADTIANQYAQLVGFKAQSISDPGEVEAWTAKTYNIPAFLVEVDQADGFQPDPSRILPQWENQKKGALYLIDTINSQPAPSTGTLPACGTTQPSTSVTVQPSITGTVQTPTTSINVVPSATCLGSCPTNAQAPSPSTAISSAPTSVGISATQSVSVSSTPIPTKSSDQNITANPTQSITTSPTQGVNTQSGRTSSSGLINRILKLLFELINQILKMLKSIFKS